MTLRRSLIYVAVALPPVALAVFGLTHPMQLTAASAEYWRNLHIATLPIFPLLGFAPWLVVRGRNLLLSWVVGVLGFLYAAFYTGLDVLAGIGAGGLKADGMGMATGTMFSLGNMLGHVGSALFIAATVIAAVTQFRRLGGRALAGGIIAIIGTLLFAKDHIYFPVGVIGQLCLALGWSLLLAAANHPPHSFRKIQESGR